MARDNFKFQNNTPDMKTKIELCIKKYTDVINRLTNEVASINSSPLWKDELIKTSFINYCNSYIKIFRKSIEIMEEYLKYFEAKTSQISYLEQSYHKKVNSNG